MFCDYFKDDGRVPCCPICGQEAYEGYYDKDGTLVGCDQCVTIKSWEDIPEWGRKRES